MCLYALWERPRIAENNIPCYKLLSIVNGVYKTAYAGHIIPKPPCILKIEKEQNNEARTEHFCLRKEIGKGYFHSYAEPYNALPDCSTLPGILFSAIIPKGCLYYEGVGNDYASTSLEIKEKICDETDCFDEDAPFCLEGNNTLTVGDIIKTLYQCTVFTNKEDPSIKWLSLSSEVPICAGHIHEALKDVEIGAAFYGFYVSHRGHPEKYHIISFSDARALLKGAVINFDLHHIVL